MDSWWCRAANAEDATEISDRRFLIPSRLHLSMADSRPALISEDAAVRFFAFALSSALKHPAFEKTPVETEPCVFEQPCARRKFCSFAFTSTRFSQDRARARAVYVTKGISVPRGFALCLLLLLLLLLACVCVCVCVSYIVV